MTDTAAHPGPATEDGSVDRRSVLRRGSALLAGVAGVGAVAAAAAPAAGAAKGDPVVQGEANDAGTDTTSLTSSSAEATLAVANGASGAAVRVEPATGALDYDAYLAATQSGDVINDAGALLFTHDDDALGEVYTDYFANLLVPIAPVRALDTRTAAGRTGVLNKAGNLDSQGRLIAGHTIQVTLADEVFLGTAGFFNLTVVMPLRGGYAVLWPTGTRPPASSINFSTGQVIANGLVCGLSENDTVQIFSSQTTHVLLDVSAFWVGSALQVSQIANAPATRAAGATKASPRRQAPSWVKDSVARRLGA
jgi:hypothetical protein